MIQAILSLMATLANTWNSERKIYFISKIRILQKKVQSVEDSDYYDKDMEKKGKAERELESKVMDLYKEIITESKK